MLITHEFRPDSHTTFGQLQESIRMWIFPPKLLHTLLTLPEPVSNLTNLGLCATIKDELFVNLTQSLLLLAIVFQFYVAKAPKARNETVFCLKTTHKFTWMSSRTWKRSSNTETLKKSCWKPNSHRLTWYWRRQRRSTSWKKSMYVRCIRFVECYKHFNNIFVILSP